MCGEIVSSAPHNISANSGRLTRQFAVWASRARLYSAAMQIRLATLLLAAWLCAAVRAEPLPDAVPFVGGALEQQVRELALGSAQGGHARLPRVEVAVGRLDPRLRLAPCAQIQPYVPEGTRMWGKSRIGLRCLQGPTRWNVYLPITVKVFGTALVAANHLAAGSVLSAADLTNAEIDLADDASAPVGRAELAIGRSLARPLNAGEGLRQSHLKARQWFAAGDTVTVLAQGTGFSVASEARALNAGIEGQPVRLRTDSGRVLTGHPVGDRRVELAL